jgi:hypothetical protein
MKSPILLPVLLLTASTLLFVSPIITPKSLGQSAQDQSQKQFQARLTHEVYGVVDSLNLSDTILNQYVGLYQVENTEDSVRFTNENHQLVAHAKNGHAFPLTAQSQTKFIVAGRNASVEFEDIVEGKAQTAEVTDKGDTKKAKRKS